MGLKQKTICCTYTKVFFLMAADQFGGAKGKKLKYVNLKQYILESLSMPMEKKGITWKKNLMIGKAIMSR